MADDLTARELQVLQMRADGLGGNEIAARLHLSAHTIKTHLCRTYKKLGARDAGHAVALGFRAGLLDREVRRG